MADVKMPGSQHTDESGNISDAASKGEDLIDELEHDEEPDVVSAPPSMKNGAELSEGSGQLVAGGQADWSTPGKARKHSVKKRYIKEKPATRLASLEEKCSRCRKKGISCEGVPGRTCDECKRGKIKCSAYVPRHASDDNDTGVPPAAKKLKRASSPTFARVKEPSEPSVARSLPAKRKRSERSDLESEESGGEANVVMPTPPLEGSDSRTNGHGQLPKKTRPSVPGRSAMDRMVPTLSEASYPDGSSAPGRTSDHESLDVTAAVARVGAMESKLKSLRTRVATASGLLTSVVTVVQESMADIESVRQELEELKSMLPALPHPL